MFRRTLRISRFAFIPQSKIFTLVKDIIDQNDFSKRKTEIDFANRLKKFVLKNRFEKPLWSISLIRVNI